MNSNNGKHVGKRNGSAQHSFPLSTIADVVSQEQRANCSVLVSLTDRSNSAYSNSHQSVTMSAVPGLVWGVSYYEPPITLRHIVGGTRQLPHKHPRLLASCQLPSMRSA